MHEQIFADPLNEHITVSSFADNKQALLGKVQLMKAHPHGLKILFAFLIIAPLFYVFFLSPTETLNIFLNVFLLLFSVMGIFLFYAYIRSIEEDLTVLLLCERNHWAFNPSRDTQRVAGMAQLFPDIFARGTAKSRYFDNQVWGTFGSQHTINFWSSTFIYEIPTQDSLYDLYKESNPEDPRKTHLFSHTALIIELDKVLPCNFSLIRRGNLNDTSFFDRFDTILETESVDFNGMFRVKANAKSNPVKAQILQALSPAVQVRLIDFANTFRINTISFQDNCMVILFDETLWKPKHTNFFKRVIIDERDIQRFNKQLNDLSALPLAMRKYLD